MKIAVVGLGEFGMSLARSLVREGASVIAADSRIEPVEDIKDEVDLAVRLDGTDEKDLHAQGIQHADALVAAMGEDFEASILVVLAAKRIGVKRVIARANNPTHAKVLAAVGADLVVVPLVEAAARLAQRILLPGVRNYFEVLEGVDFAEVEAPEDLQGRTLVEIDLRQKHQVNLVAILRKKGEKEREQVNPVPRPDEVIRAGDVLAVVGRSKAVAAFAQACAQR